MKMAWMGLVLGAAVQAGCAVTTVDVDVYKGPLANSESVQDRQAASIAVAAKPLLARLRYKLEVSKRIQDAAADAVTKRNLLSFREDVLRSDEAKQLDQSAYYEPNFRFVSPEGRYVNQIMAQFNTKEEDEELQGSKLRGTPVSDSQPVANAATQGSPKQSAISLRGRSPEGLETLIYHDSEGGRKLVGTDETHEMVTARLITIAQQILFVANDEVLMKDSKGLIPGTLLFASSALWGGIDRHGDQTYVRVMQSIGNSILVQLDEISTHGQYKETQENTERLSIAKVARGRISGLPAPDGLTTTGAVWRDLADQLNTEYIEYVRKNGSAGDGSKNLLEAVHAAQERANNESYIRPASEYLRTTYPATSLQSSPPIGWENQLERQALRSFPFVPTFLAQNDPDAKAVREIDKQFWQNINRVRVAGAGVTNQVLVKDDVGNWYVKSYSANTDKVTKSMIGLATMGMSSSAQTLAMIAQLPKDDQLAYQKKLIDQRLSAQTYDVEYQTLEAKHAAAIKTQEGTIDAFKKSLADTLSKQVKAGVTEEMDFSVIKPLLLVTAPVSTGKVVDDLDAILTGRDKLLADLEKIKVSDSTAASKPADGGGGAATTSSPAPTIAPASKTAAKDAISKVYSDGLSPVITAYGDELKTYQSSLTNLSAAATQPASGTATVKAAPSK